jgi:hypothetical protein
MSGFCDRFNYPSITARLDGSVALFSTKEDAVRFFTAVRERVVLSTLHARSERDRPAP